MGKFKQARIKRAENRKTRVLKIVHMEKTIRLQTNGLYLIEFMGESNLDNLKKKQ